MNPIEISPEAKEAESNAIQNYFTSIKTHEVSATEQAVCYEPNQLGYHTQLAINAAVARETQAQKQEPITRGMVEFLRQENERLKQEHCRLLEQLQGVPQIDLYFDGDKEGK